MALIDIIIPLVIVGGTYLIRYLKKMPLFYDLYGKESKKISNHNNVKKYMNELIADASRLEMKEVKIIADADEVKQMIQETKKEGFKIKAITSFKDPIELEEMNLLQNDLIEIRESQTRPMKHFAIIGPHLLVESPHSIASEEKSAFVIRHPGSKYYNYFINRFDACWRRLDQSPPISTNSNMVPPIYKSSTEPYEFDYPPLTSNDN